MVSKSEEMNLSERDTEILRLLAMEFSEPEIAGQLGLNIETLDNVVQVLCARAGIRLLRGLMKESVKRGWI